MTLLPTRILPDSTYPFIDFRDMLSQMALQPGVVGPSDFKVVQHAGTPNMSVDVGAGYAWVLGTDTTRQGVYNQVNDGTVSVTVNASDGTNPRIDQIALKINDASVAGVSDTPQLLALTGSATPGATLANRNGAAALPLTCLRLADVLVPAGSSSVLTANIRDRRPWARGARWSESFASGATTSTNTPGTIVSAASVRRLECSGGPLECSISSILQNTIVGSNVGFALLMDGSSIKTTSMNTHVASVNDPLLLEHVFTPSAGSHLFQWNFWVSNGTAVATTMTNPIGRIREIIGSGDNGST